MSRKSARNQPKPVAGPTQPQAPASGKSRRNLFIAAGAALVVAAAGGTLWALRSGAASTEADAARRAGLASPHSPTLGDPLAKVHIVEFLDPACETCASFYPMVKQMLAENPQRIRLSIRHVPFHPGSEQVVALLEASRKQGKYWQALEALLASQGVWVDRHVAQPALAQQIVAGLGLDPQRLAADMQAPDVLQHIAQDKADAALLEVRQTPEYFVNGRQMPSFGRQQLQDLVRDALQRAY